MDNGADGSNIPDDKIDLDTRKRWPSGIKNVTGSGSPRYSLFFILAEVYLLPVIKASGRKKKGRVNPLSNGKFVPKRVFSFTKFTLLMSCKRKNKHNAGELQK